MSETLERFDIQLKKSNFEFMKLDSDLTEFYKTATQAELDFALKAFDNTLVNVRKIVDSLTSLIIDLNYDFVPNRATFNDKLSIIKSKKYDIPSAIIDLFYDIKSSGNMGAHSVVGDEELAYKALNQLRIILHWYITTQNDIKIIRSEFVEPTVVSRFKNNRERKIVYVQTADNNSGNWSVYEGNEKIGETTAPEEDQEENWSPNSDFLQSVTKKRINSYMKTSGVPAKISWAELAWIKESKRWFSDKDVHEVLLRSGYKRSEKLDGTEWFEVDLETAKVAIKAVKEGRSSIDSKNDIDLPKINLRSEQTAAVNQATKAFKKHNKVLWNAKMRFGKTLSTYELIKRNKYEKVLVMTHRPVVSDSWFEDFKKIEMAKEGYEYASKIKGEKDLRKLANGKTPFIYFVSIQDLRGAIEVGGKHEKNSEFFEINWDLIVVDEAHEGTQTDRGDRLYESLMKTETKMLELSGTPFNILDEFSEEQVFTWDYIMEQQAKIRFSLENPEKVNPYEALPEVEMYTFQMAVDKQYENSDKYFDFAEFFKVEDNSGKFVHESSIIKWLDQISTDGKTNYPFSTEEFRESIRHTLWLLPSRASARALKELLDHHAVFSEYSVVNIVNDNDNEIAGENDKDLVRVRKVITDRPSATKTIILTVRKLTTGVNIPALNGVVFLNNTTSAQNYLQAAFRAQTPFSDEILGMKKKAYIFDFAPDRALNILAKSVSMSPKAGVLNTNDQRDKLGTLLNFLPVIEQSGNEMKTFSVDKMMRQLKKAYAERAVLSGFDDASIYNDELWEVTQEEINLFNDLSGKLGKTQQTKATKKIDVNTTGLNEQEREKVKRGKKKPKKERTPEEQAAIEAEQKLRKERNNMISILRGISIRIPLMIYGMNLDLDKDITLEDFIKQVDDVSWEEFMPKGISKFDFMKFKKFYDPEIFIEAGHRIRQAAVSANNLSYQDRIEKITSIFSGFKNPDKETVLTPWRVVNLQLGKTIGGYNFYDEEYREELKDASFRYIDNGEITNEIFSKDAKILEINSKTGLYPLYMAFNIYQRRYLQENENWNKADYIQKDKALWQEVLENNIFALNKTPMARTITYRTLNGYEVNEKFEKNLVYIEGLTTRLKHNVLEMKNEILSNFGGENMKFDAIIGNPPYQEMDGGAQASAGPTYHYFVQVAKSLNPKYISMIMPSRWYVGGKGLDEFRSEMLNDIHLREMYDWLTPEDIFPNTNIRGGVCYFLWDREYDNVTNLSKFVTYENNKIISDIVRPIKLNNLDILVRDSKAISILEKIENVEGNRGKLMKYISASKPFGLRGYFIKDKNFHETTSNLKNPVQCYGRAKVGYVEYENIPNRHEWINKWKVFAPKSNNIGTELSDDNFNTIIGMPNTICTETYLVFGADLGLNQESAENLSKYLKTKFFRYLHSLAKASQDAALKTYRFIPVQDFENNSDINWKQSSDDISKQLYKKYNFSIEEIAHVESKIKLMI
ncbi:restriction endonuclease [Lysinibacillus sp. BF-4]|uniref:Eco57I restriction-modification methylase domain-containing protein n=1 Tax=Lysinibacillus sp. BF-4 TaxID=1473546 RepID=UPI0005087942|nr:Eco57I restriction-modification methylase domain-containing protein [Lysinibacillus sp. BF-4]KFL42554.1 restriction endonuclease [Lysinibacillus sp. BF-4]